MIKFDFNEWSFEYGDPDGPLGSNIVFLKEIIDESDIHFVSGVKVPILTRSAITKIMERMKFSETDFIPVISKADDETGFIIAVKIVMLDEKKNKFFIGNGEASLKNTKSNISSDYPLAMAVKRARSRAIIDYLKITAYGEDEAPNFSKISEEEIPDELVRLISHKSLRKFLLDNIKDLAKNRENPLSKEELIETVKFILKFDKEKEMIVSDLKDSDLLTILIGLSIEKFLSPEAMAEYANRRSE